MVERHETGVVGDGEGKEIDVGQLARRDLIGDAKEHLVRRVLSEQQRPLQLIDVLTNGTQGICCKK